jgi:hypothetical protein
MKVKDTSGSIKDITDATIQAIEELNRKTQGRYHPVYRLIRIFPNVNNNEVAEEVTRLAETLSKDRELRELAQEPEIKKTIDTFLQVWGQDIISRTARQMQALTDAMKSAGITLEQSPSPAAPSQRNQPLISGGEEVSVVPAPPPIASQPKLSSKGK